MIRVERSRPQERAAIMALLHASDLPPDGLDADNVTLLAARDDDRLVGCAALEWHGRSVLLRSVAVQPGQRGAGVGARLVREALSMAEGQATDAFLLTTDASDYFRGLGFRRVARDEVAARAPELAASVQFTTACPASAQAMRRSLDHDRVTHTRVVGP